MHTQDRVRKNGDDDGAGLSCCFAAHGSTSTWMCQLLGETEEGERGGGGRRPGEPRIPARALSPIFDSIPGSTEKAFRIHQEGRPSSRGKLSSMFVFILHCDCGWAFPFSSLFFRLIHFLLSADPFHAFQHPNLSLLLPAQKRHSAHRSRAYFQIQRPSRRRCPYRDPKP